MDDIKFIDTSTKASTNKKSFDVLEVETSEASDEEEDEINCIRSNSNDDDDYASKSNESELKNEDCSESKNELTALPQLEKAHGNRNAMNNSISTKMAVSETNKNKRSALEKTNTVSPPSKKREKRKSNGKQSADDSPILANLDSKQIENCAKISNCEQSAKDWKNETKVCTSSIIEMKVSGAKKCEPEAFPSIKSFKNPEAFNLLDTLSKGIYAFMRRKNRPLSIANILSENNYLTRMQTTKSLNRLVEAGMLRTKDDGKVFWFNQSAFSDLSAGSTCTLKDIIEEFNQSTAVTRSQLNELKIEINTLESEPTDSTISNDIESLRSDLEKRKSYRAGIEIANGNSNAHNSKSENDFNSTTKNQIDTNNIDYYSTALRFYLSEWKKRKESVVDFVENLRDTMPPKTKISKLYDDLGIESDEIFGKLPKDIPRLQDL